MRALILAGLISLCVMPWHSVAQAGGDTEEKIVNIRLAPGRAEDVFAYIFSASGMVYVLGPGVGNVETPQVTIQDKPLESAVKWFCEKLALTYQTADGIYRFERKKIPPADSSTSPANTNHDSPESLVQPLMTRYEVRQALGKPNEIIESPVVGNDTWRFGSTEIVFRSARVCAIRPVPRSQVSLGVIERPRVARPPPELAALRPPPAPYPSVSPWVYYPSCACVVRRAPFAHPYRRTTPRQYTVVVRTVRLQLR